MKNRMGYTLLSLMLSLAIFVTITLLISSIMLTLAKNNRQNLDMQKEKNIFFQQTLSEVQRASSISCTEKKLSLTSQDGEDITFQQSGHILYRQVFEKGYDIALQNVQDARFSCTEKTISISVTDTDGETNEWWMRSYVDQTN
ncbi:competence type IV pilus minor pilin ComGF [Terrilactibacillus laevilacticus]|uniref:Competence type IV pilus minor pilin ComGF n=1 Tax=Terrilactibacillus laevilacticus TaxID=1380157 RepID=A0ABW5PTN8_9BACI|nr:competence type IV pilus minor pilin ComGF [Terrilactibacillus laevilacticus]